MPKRSGRLKKEAPNPIRERALIHINKRREKYGMSDKE
jgi:hypothetical protein